MRTAGGLFNGGEVLRLPGERRGAAFHLRAGAPPINAPPIVNAVTLASVIASLRIIVLLETFRPLDLTQHDRRSSRQIDARSLCIPNLYRAPLFWQPGKSVGGLCVDRG